MEILRLGSSGPHVSMLQLALKRAGYFSQNPDGLFGTELPNAVAAFQNANRLDPDGVVNAETWSALGPFLLGYLLITARRGDTFQKLAEKYETGYDAIAAANPGLDPINLRIGKRVAVPLNFPVVPTNIPFCSALLEFCVRGLKARYPFISSGVIGTSVAGRPIHCLRIGSGENKVFYNAAHHANEWITAPLLLKFIEDYAHLIVFNGRLIGAESADLYKKTTLFMVPMVNPDGVDLVLNVFPKFSLYYEKALDIASDYPEIPFPSGWKANISGVDPNLQYPAGWGDARKIKFSQGYITPAPKNYVGKSPLAAPESAAIQRFTEQNRFNLTLNYHTQGREIYWKYLDKEPPGSLDIAARFAKSSGYALLEAPLESGYAGYKDWFIERFSKPSFTIEAGSGESPLPLSQFDEIYKENLGILTFGLETA